MKGFPRRGSNSGLLEGWVVARIAASMKGFPRRGSNAPLTDRTTTMAMPQ